MNQAKTTMIVYGPSGIGKTKNANRIAKTFELNQIVDPWSPGDPIPIKDTLVVTNIAPDLHAKELKKYRMMDFKLAMEEVFLAERVAR